MNGGAGVAGAAAAPAAGAAPAGGAAGAWACATPAANASATPARTVIFMRLDTLRFPPVTQTPGRRRAPREATKTSLPPCRLGANPPVLAVMVQAARQVRECPRRCVPTRSPHSD